MNLLILARKLIYDDTGDKEPDAWKSIAKLLNERADPKSYKEFRVYNGEGAKDWYNRLQAEENSYIIWWEAIRSLVVIVKSSTLHDDPELLRTLMATVK